MKAFVLHVGLPKTGTSTLQKTVFKSHPEIFYLGKNLETDIPRGCRSVEVHKLLDPLLWHPHGAPKAEVLHSLYKANVLDQVSDNQVVLASWEALGNGDKRKFEGLMSRVTSVTGSMKLMIGLRNPLTWVGSEYLQGVQGQYMRSSRGKHFKHRPFISFEIWLQNHTGRRGVEKWLSYAENVKSAISTLGRENVGIFLFEDLISNPEAYYLSIAEFLEIDKEQVLSLSRESHYNKRLLTAEVEHIQYIDSSSSLRRRWKTQDITERRRELQKYLKSTNANLSPAKVVLSKEWQQKISEGTRNGNQWLASELGLDLEKHDYPM
jgi:hypothetical protein